MTGVLFATIDTDDLLQGMGKVNGTTHDTLLIFGAVLAVTVILIIWAAFVRKRSRDRSSRRSHHAHESTSHSHDANHEVAADPRPKRRKWRRRRRDHRPRNPTLAETGGLPPVRSESSDEPGR